MRHVSLFLLLGILVLSVTAQATESSTPRQIVSSLYAPYLNNQPNTPDALTLIKPHASQSLKHAIDKEHACQKREQGLCRLDFDIIVNAQDWDLSDLSLKEDGSAVQARFVNGTTNLVNYMFIREHGQWKIDDIEATRLTVRGRVDSVYRLKPSLLEKP